MNSLSPTATVVVLLLMLSLFTTSAVPASAVRGTELKQVTGQTQQEMNDEACGNFRRTDVELNRVYARILREYAKDRVFTRKLRAAQRAWLAFRDAHVASVYPDPAATAYGSVNPMCRCNLLNQLTRERLDQLRQWVDGTVEGNSCAGSVQSRK